MDDDSLKKCTDACEKFQRMLLAGNLKKASSALRKMRKSVKKAKKTAKRNKKMLAVLMPNDSSPAPQQRPERQAKPKSSVVEAAIANEAAQHQDPDSRDQCEPAAEEETGDPAMQCPFEESLFAVFRDRLPQFAHTEVIIGEQEAPSAENAAHATDPAPPPPASSAKPQAEKKPPSGKKSSKTSSTGATPAPPSKPAANSLENFGFTVVRKKPVEAQLASGGAGEGSTPAGSDSPSSATQSANAVAAPKKLRFGAFTQSTRIVPAALRFWDDANCLVNNAAAAADAASEAAFSTAAIIQKDFPSVGGAFDAEAVLIGYFSTTYEPVEARPPFYGTQNSQLADVMRIARFPAGEEMPRSNQFDYEYDSGDDWDSDGEGVDRDSDEDDEKEGEGEALNGEGSEVSESDGDSSFINDGDLDFEDQDDREDHAVQARRDERRARIRKKDKLIGVASGPFADIELVNHPFQAAMEKDADVFEFLHGYNPSAIQRLLEIEANPAAAAAAAAHAGSPLAASGASPAARVPTTCPPEVAEHLHQIIRQRNRANVKELTTLVQMRFTSVKKAVVERTITKFYEYSKMAGWLAREVPLPDTHELLRPQQQRPASGSATKATPAKASASTAKGAEGSPSATPAGCTSTPIRATEVGAELREAGGISQDAEHTRLNPEQDFASVAPIADGVAATIHSEVSLKRQREGDAEGDGLATA